GTIWRRDDSWRDLAAFKDGQVALAHGLTLFDGLCATLGDRPKHPESLPPAARPVGGQVRDAHEPGHHCSPRTNRRPWSSTICGSGRSISAASWRSEVER